MFQVIKAQLDLESIGSSLDWRGPDIRPGLENRHLIIEGHRGHGRSCKVKEGQERSWMVFFHH